MTQHCEACEIGIAEVVEHCDDAARPYHLCKACHRRLLARALRPREWYNLAKRHGIWGNLLCPDLYDEEGHADQPLSTVRDAANSPALTLDDVRHDVDALLAHCMTRRVIDDEILAAWWELPEASVLNALYARFEQDANPGIRTRALEVGAAVLGDHAADFVREAWRHSNERIPLLALAEASAQALPRGEAFERVSTTLQALDKHEQREAMYALASLHCSETLDWIEQHVSTPVSDGWGYLAALSGIDWPRLRAWLNGGRPLSLVALDALVALQRLPSAIDEHDYRNLRSAPSLDELQSALYQHSANDSTPRVRKRTDSILAAPALLIQSA